MKTAKQSAPPRIKFLRSADEIDMIEIFKTDVEDVNEANQLIQLLHVHFPDTEINFDLQDCDNILRVQGNHLLPEKIIALLQRRGFYCELLS